MSRAKLKVAIAAGGTGGHIYPGIAVAEEIRSRFPAAEILFIGSEEGMEKDLVPRYGFTLSLIKSRALIRKISYQSFSAPFILIIGFIQSLLILSRFKPAKILSTGGYAGLPAVLAAKLLRIPIYLHEQNVLPGITNRLCSKIADKVFLSFEESKRFLPGLVAGNPVRREILAADRAACRTKFKLDPNRKTVLVIGGSQGSRKINQSVLASLAKFPADKFEIMHVIGARDFALARNVKFDFYHPFAYLYNVAEALAAADLVVSRAGATALAEFTARGLPMILIPFPFSAEGHQDLNARFISDNGAGIIISNDNFTPDQFIAALVRSEGKLQEMGAAAKRLANPAAAAKIVDALLGIL